MFFLEKTLFLHKLLSKMKIKLYNSLTKKIEDFVPINPNEIKMYSCGPTVYSFAHIGNMRAFLFADLLQRTLKVVGKYNVKWVMNITNIDDKTIRDSKVGSTEWLDEWGEQKENPHHNLNTLTNYYEQEFIKDIEKVGIKRNDLFAIPRATNYIKQMQDLIRILLDKGIAYGADGSIYFNVNEYRKTEKYGKLLKIDFDNFKAGLRVDTDQYERDNVSDFVLWKCKKEGEPFWDFYVGDVNYQGRPGWHLECSAMEYEILGMPFDIHTGGVDLKFPHHEDEIAQSKAGYGIEPTNYWCHNEFLEVEGSKMSKSLGNIFTIRDLEKKNVNPIDIRYAMLSAHYRTKYNFTIKGIEDAKKARVRIQDYIHSCLEKIDFNMNNNVETEKINTLKENIFTHLADDLHTPKALATLFTFINNNQIDTLSNDEITNFINIMKELNEVFVAWSFTKPEQKINDIPQNIIELASQRLAAKKNKDFTIADNLRKQITELGYNILDTKEGYTIGHF
jgi:cysteinyl-tRNA synthetase